MNNSNTTVVGQARTSVSNKVLKNTYILLSITLLFSAATAFISYIMNFSIINPFNLLKKFLCNDNKYDKNYFSRI